MALPANPKFKGSTAWKNTAMSEAVADGDAIAALSDSSGNGFHVTQSNAANRFIYKSNGIAAGQPGYLLDGTDYLTNASLGAQLTGDFTIGLIIKGTDKSVNGMPISWGDVGTGKGRRLWIDTAGHANFSAYDANVMGTKDVKDGIANVVVLRRLGTSITIRVNKVQVGSGTPALNDYSSTAFSIGANPSGTEGYKDYLREPIAYGRALTGSDLDDFENYLTALTLEPDTTPPSDVTGLTVSSVAANSVSLDWNDAADNIAVTDYKLERATDAAFTQNVASADLGSAVSAKLVTGLEPDTKYFFRAKAKDGSGNYSANWSNVADAATKPDFLLFPLEMSGLSQQPEYFTTVTDGKSGRESRNANWDQPIRYFNAMFAVKTQKDVALIRAFFHAVKGRFKLFYLKDWTEFKYDFTPTVETGNGARTQFQMRLVYEDVLGNQHNRTNFRPRKGTVFVKVAGVTKIEGVDFAVNYVTAKITFTNPPANGAVITQKCEFYVPVRFDTDRMPSAELFAYWLDLSETERALYNVDQFPMKELR